jgi:zinc protease
MAESAISRTVVDGVPVFHAPDSSSSLTHAALMFRVGSSDEDLPTHGITHLVEHLALNRTASKSYGHNAQVELTRTVFWVEGTSEEVCEFFAAVTESLSDLQVDRIEDEKRVLRTEAASQAPGSPNNRLSTRFGAMGFGLVDYDQFGLRWIGAAHAVEWSQRWFTSGNAAALVHGPLPDALHFRLPPGERRPVAKAQPVALTYPAISDAGNRGITVSMVEGRTSPLYMGARILDKRIKMRLRYEASLSYQAGATYFGLDAETAEITAYADALPENLQAAGDHIHAVISELATTGPTSDELKEDAATFRRDSERPERIIAELDRSASDQIFGTERPTISALADEFDAMSTDEVTKAMQSAKASIVTIVPPKTQVRFAGFTTTDPPLTRPLGDRMLKAMPGQGHADTMHYGPQGMSLVSPGGNTIYSIPWSQVAVALWWSEGRKTLIGLDGVAINFFPERWQDALHFAETLRTQVPARKWVPMDEPGALPRNVEVVCSICEATPAAEWSIRSWTPNRRNRVRALLCRDCAIAEFRRCTATMIAWCWMPVYWLFMPIGIFSNLITRIHIGELPPPVRTAGKNPLKKGRPVYLRPAMIGPSLWLLGLFVVAFSR